MSSRQAALYAMLGATPGAFVGGVVGAVLVNAAIASLFVVVNLVAIALLFGWWQRTLPTWREKRAVSWLMRALPEGDGEFDHWGARRIADACKLPGKASNSVHDYLMGEQTVLQLEQSLDRRLGIEHGQVGRRELTQDHQPEIIEL